MNTTATDVSSIVSPAEVSAAKVAAPKMTATSLAYSGSNEGSCWDCEATQKDSGDGRHHCLS
jgi:hypothetical protein